MEDKQDNHMDIFKESIERGLAAVLLNVIKPDHERIKQVVN